MRESETQGQPVAAEIEAAGPAEKESNERVMHGSARRARYSAQVTIVAVSAVGVLLLAAAPAFPAESAAATAPPIEPRALQSAAIEPPALAPVADAGWDPEVRRGVLPNGLTWMVRRNALPQGRLSARVVKRVGSLQEQDAERGLAHFCEHMAFNGSPHFAPGALSSAEGGINIDPHVNAYTGWDGTHYLVDLPSGTPAELSRALDLVEDFVRGSTLVPVEIEKERGVVLSELRRGRGTSERMGDAYMRLAFGASLHAKRDPIGLPDVIAGAKASDIADFCRRWARPDVTGVAIVGDFDEELVATQVVARLGALPKAVGEAPPFVPPLPPEGVVVAMHADPELPATEALLAWFRLLPPETPKPIEARTSTRDDRSAWLAEEMAADILQRRLWKAPWGPGSPLMEAKVGYSGLVQRYDSLEIGVTPRDGRLLEAVTLVAAEVERLRRDGPCPAELEAALARRRSQHESWMAQESRHSSDEIVGRLEEALADDGLAIADDAQDLLTRAALATLDAKAIRDQFARRVSWDHVGALAFGPRDLPASPALKAAVEKGRDAAPPAAPCVARVVAELVPNPPPPGKVTSRRRLEDLAADELMLSNGMRVLLKRATFQLDEVELAAIAPGGYATGSRMQRVASEFTSEALFLSGSTDHDHDALYEPLTGKKCSLSFEFGPFSARAKGVSGSDLEPLTQLLHAWFARAIFRRETVAHLRTVRADSLRSAMADPTSRVMRATQQVGGVALFDWPSTEEVSALTDEQVDQAWRALVGSPAGWTLAFVGDFDLEASIPIVERWLASIPAVGPARPDVIAQMRAMPAKAEPEVRSVHVTTSEPDQCLTALVVPLRGERDAAIGRRLDRVSSLLASRLNARMREDLGETYSVDVGRMDFDGHPRLGQIMIVFDSNAASRPRLVAIAREEVERLRREPPTAAEVAAVRADELANWAQESKTHGAWAWALASSARGEDPRVMLTREKEIAAVTPASLHEAARRWIGKDTIDVHAAP